MCICMYVIQLYGLSCGEQGVPIHIHDTTQFYVRNQVIIVPHERYGVIVYG